MTKTLFSLIIARMNLPYRGLLLTQDFLTLGIRAQLAYSAISPQQVNDFAARCAEGLKKTSAKGVNETRTRNELITPILDALDWENAQLPEETIIPGHMPDYLLYKDEETKQQAAKKPPQKRAKDAVVLVESKKRGLPLDKHDKQEGTPSSQILRYLRAAEETPIEWGILTDGILWRLYYRYAQSRSERFLELDIEDILALPEEERAHWLRVFILIFGRDSFLLKHGPQKTVFQLVALEECKKWELAITDSLSRQILENIFPQLGNALAENLPKLKSAMDAAAKKQHYDVAECDMLLERVRDNTVILLFRMLFVLYAEDRSLLPTQNGNYQKYSLRKIRNEVESMTDKEELSPTIGNLYPKFSQLCKAIDQGDSSLSLPPYNGGLFSAEQADMLPSAEVSDRVFGGVIDLFSRSGDQHIHYHDLSVQHLGAMYEQLLEQELYITPEGHIAARLNRFSRKTGGSYYTPDNLVRLLIERTVGNLLEQRRKKGKDMAADALKIKVCDPAMGSGHFLVMLVDYLADFALTEIANTEYEPENQSSLSSEIEEIRKGIKKDAKKGGWEIKDELLEDRQIIRRIVLKKCVYGADKNFIAVELAKLSLWLHTFTVGAPLTFLDHHLRCGDSLFGELGVEARKRFEKMRCGMAAQEEFNNAESATEEMFQIEQLSDSDIAQVEASKQKFGKMREKAKKMEYAMSLLQCLRWMKVIYEDNPSRYQKCLTSASNILLDLFKKKKDNGKINKKADNGLDSNDIKFQQEAEAIMARESFMHWEVAFPGVWQKWGSNKYRKGGFDAIIGNPPWNRIKMQEVEWFAMRMPEVSMHATQSARKTAIEKLRKKGHPIIADYEKARLNTSCALTVAKTKDDDGGYYPQLGKGDTNIYALFVERALTLANPDALVGLLVPSGIYGDKTSSEFFSSIASSKRLHTIFDFTNRPNHFFPDVDSRFKFCIFIFGGKRQKINNADCAFFLNSTDNIKDKIITIKNEDFRRANPNTCTAPIFCNQRDAKITLEIYSRLPILHDHKKQSTWAVKFVRMLDLTNDSNKFQSASKLENAGYYLLPSNHYEHKDNLCLPLYVGRMIWHFNHRANSVRQNPANIHNPNFSEPSTIEQLEDINYCATPAYWVNTQHVNLARELGWVLGFRNTTNATNERTIIASLAPRAAFGNSLPILPPILPIRPNTSDEKELAKWRKKYDAAIDDYKQNAPLYAANLSSFALDFVARQKMQGTSANWYIMEQLPVIPLSNYQEKINGQTIADFIRHHVLQLAYTSHDMDAFARDMGYKGKPFVWDEEERNHLRARLDALYFILYGIDRKDAAYIMDSFPIVRRNDERKYDGYLTRDLILNYMNALSSGNYTTKVKTPDYS